MNAYDWSVVSTLIVIVGGLAAMGVRHITRPDEYRRKYESLRTLYRVSMQANEAVVEAWDHGDRQTDMPLAVTQCRSVVAIAGRECDESDT